LAATNHTLVALVEDRPGVLNKVSSLFRRRGFNIDSITVGHSELPHMSRMTIVVDGPATMVEQVRKQLEKLIDVVKVTDITGGDIVIRELVLVKVKSTSASRSEIVQIVDIFKAKIVGITIDSLTIEVTGDDEKLNIFLNLLRGFGIKEISRSGRIAMVRSDANLASGEERSDVAE
jgi:acetolactate synthase-1/3 small subunit